MKPGRIGVNSVKTSHILRFYGCKIFICPRDTFYAKGTTVILF